jgi:hypothetical protein
MDVQERSTHATSLYYMEVREQRHASTDLWPGSFGYGETNDMTVVSS